ncbi:hypothetical protein JSY36_18115 [Bacillus sp. H-16]|uniref:hypothetical protein n=1 Tax=Alteribacter salitolerans TaxID=2912333 RepID=UPI0019662C26|nr:hypothetical protein [Alteribacter salitolerans]MBM7097654.1 hypothetical protein [Alteribacter salitolerans]
MDVLSQESKRFLENVKLYLTMNGKKENEVEEIVEELEDHLLEAERNRKDVSHITGLSPKEYMKELAGEMSFDRKGMLKLVSFFLAGVMLILF